VSAVAGVAFRLRLFASALALVQLSPRPRRFAAFHGLPQCRLFLRRVTPLGRTDKETSMTMFDVALLLKAMAQLVAALATLIATIRRRR
jgi:hypothetical protein